MNSLQELLSDFLSFVKINTRSDEKSQSIPTTPGQKELALLLKRKLEDLGLSQVQFLEDCAFTIGCLRIVLIGKKPRIYFDYVRL